MQERHINRDRYFEEQAQTTRKYYIPYIKRIVGDFPEKVLEVGCGEGGNLLPFAESGCEIVGVDIASLRIEQARTFFARRNQRGTFIASDIFRLKDQEKHFPLILVHDVIEHINDKSQFLSGMKGYLSSGGVLFIAFPAWQMPFGGHQQIARGRVVSHLPFIHLLPRVLYKWILDTGGEEEDTIKENELVLMEIQMDSQGMIAKEVKEETLANKVYSYIMGEDADGVEYAKLETETPKPYF